MFCQVSKGLLSLTHLVKQGGMLGSSLVTPMALLTDNRPCLPVGDLSVRLPQIPNHDTPFHKQVPLQIQNKEYK